MKKWFAALCLLPVAAMAAGDSAFEKTMYTSCTTEGTFKEIQQLILQQQGQYSVEQTCRCLASRVAAQPGMVAAMSSGDTQSLAHRRAMLQIYQQTFACSAEAATRALKALK